MPAAAVFFSRLFQLQGDYDRTGIKLYEKVYRRIVPLFKTVIAGRS
jgi:hypothetical protein